MPGSEFVRKCPACQANIYKSDVLDERQLIELVRSTEPERNIAKLEFYQRMDGTLMLVPGKCANDRLLIRVTALAILAADGGLLAVLLCVAEPHVVSLVAAFIVFGTLGELGILLLRLTLKIKFPSFPIVWGLAVPCAMLVHNSPISAASKIIVCLIVLLHACLALINTMATGPLQPKHLNGVKDAEVIDQTTKLLGK
jgi:hypothetical protein